jgi:hypothetical protein
MLVRLLNFRPENLGLLFRVNIRIGGTRVTGNVSSPVAADNQPALNTFVDQPRGIAFQAAGSRVT